MTSQRWQFRFVSIVFAFLWLRTEAWVIQSNSYLQPWTRKQGSHKSCSLKWSSKSWQPRTTTLPPTSRGVPPRTKVYLAESSLPMLDVSPLLVVVIALGLGVAAQGFINQMLEGDQGLGAYLKDGSGYNKSGFRKVASSKTEKVKDPLPWLKLPQLDFVEVAGQTNSKIQEQQFLEELESLRQEMNEKLEQGKVLEASAIRDELESRMKEAGIEYKSN